MVSRDVSKWDGRAGAKRGTHHRRAGEVRRNKPSRFPWAPRFDFLASNPTIYPSTASSFALMEGYLASIQTAFTSSTLSPSPSPHAVISLFFFNPQQHAALQHDLAHRPLHQSMITQRISKSNANLPDVVVERTASLIEALLEYVVDAPPIALLVDSQDRNRNQWLAKASLAAWQEAQAKWAIVFK